MRRVFFFLARGLLSLFFIVSGIFKVLSWQETAHAFHLAVSHIQGSFLPWKHWDILQANLPIVLGLALLFEVGGALCILTGMKIRVGALCLLLFMIPVTLSLPVLWWEHGGEERERLLDFFKNLSLIGALLYCCIHPYPSLYADAKDAKDAKYSK